MVNLVKCNLMPILSLFLLYIL